MANIRLSDDKIYALNASIVHVLKNWEFINNDVVPSLPVLDTNNDNNEDEWFDAKIALPAKTDWHLGFFRDKDSGWIITIPFMCSYIGKEQDNTTKEGWIIHNCTDNDKIRDDYKNLQCVWWKPAHNE